MNAVPQRLKKNHDDSGTIHLTVMSLGLRGWIVFSAAMLLLAGFAAWIFWTAYHQPDFWKIPQYVAGGLMAFITIMMMTAPVLGYKPTQIRGRKIILESKIRTSAIDINDLSAVERSIRGGGLEVMLKFSRGKFVCILPEDTCRDPVKKWMEENVLNEGMDFPFDFDPSEASPRASRDASLETERQSFPFRKGRFPRPMLSVVAGILYLLFWLFLSSIVCRDFCLNAFGILLIAIASTPLLFMMVTFIVELSRTKLEKKVI